MKSERSQLRTVTVCLFGTIIGVIISLLAILVAFILSILATTGNASQDTEISDLFEDVNDAVDNCNAKFDILYHILEELQASKEFTQCIEGLCSNYPRNMNSLNLLGCWNADTNSPPIVSGIGEPNDARIVCTAGNTVIDGNGNWGVGDLIIYEADLGIWIKNQGSPNEEVQCLLTNEQYELTFDSASLSTPVTVNVTVFLYGNDFYQISIPEITGNFSGVPSHNITSTTSLPVNRTTATTLLEPLIIINEGAYEIGKLTFNSNGYIIMDTLGNPSINWTSPGSGLIGGFGCDFTYSTVF